MRLRRFLGDAKEALDPLADLTVRMEATYATRLGDAVFSRSWQLGRDSGSWLRSMTLRSSGFRVAEN